MPTSDNHVRDTISANTIASHGIGSGLQTGGTNR